MTYKTRFATLAASVGIVALAGACGWMLVGNFIMYRMVSFKI